MTSAGYAVGSYLFYVAVSVTLTIWVARTLHRSGRIFLVDTFQGNEGLADSVNQLLVVGFYLINVGYVLVALHSDTKPGDLVAAIEFVSTKIGTVMLVVGVMHFFNLYLFTRLRHAAPMGRRA